MDRLAEIDKRLHAVAIWPTSPDGRCFTDDLRSRLSNYIAPDSALDFFDHAPADIVWLVGEVERLRGENATAQSLVRTALTGEAYPLR